MRWDKIFISYDTGDKELVTKITDSLERIGLEPFKAPDHKEIGSDLALKVIHAINDSNCFVPILTQNSIKSQWVNQEIGYAYSREELPIFPVVESGLQIKGFVHHTKENIQLDGDNPDNAIHDLISSLRNYINRNLSTVNKIYITCKICTKKYSIDLLSHGEIVRAIEENRLIATHCNGCKSLNNLSPKTFEIKNHLKIA